MHRNDDYDEIYLVNSEHRSSMFIHWKFNKCQDRAINPARWHIGILNCIVFDKLWTYNREISGGYQPKYKTKSPSTLVEGDFDLHPVWSGRRDLNSGPHGPEPCALAGLSHAPICTHMSLSKTTLQSTATYNLPNCVYFRFYHNHPGVTNHFT